MSIQEDDASFEDGDGMWAVHDEKYILKKRKPMLR